VSRSQDFTSVFTDLLLDSDRNIALIGSRVVRNSDADVLVFTGTGGNDDLPGSLRADRIDGLGGNDTLYGLDGDDTLDGGAGDDLIDGGNGRDTVPYDWAGAAVSVSLLRTSAQATGGGGTDTLRQVENLVGTRFDDRLTGSTGDNHLEGGLGNDTILASGGDDIIGGGLGTNLLDGGSGSDWVLYDWADAAVSVNLLRTTAQNTWGAGIDTLLGVENLLGTRFNDRLTGNIAANTLVGGEGNDTLLGSSGNDTLAGGTGDDYMDAGTGRDAASYADAGSAVTVSLLVTTAQNTGGGGTDTLLGVESLIGSRFADTLTGNSTHNMLEGGDGDDTLDGGLRNDTLTGGAGDDLLLGGGWNDILTGGFGQDTLAGGQGSDQFIITFAGGYDIIADLSHGDQIVVEGLETLVLTGGNGTNVAAGTVQVSNTGLSTVLYFGINASPGADAMVELAGHQLTPQELVVQDNRILLRAPVPGEERVGSESDDFLMGTSGNDTLRGLDGNDYLFGGNGNDLLDGGPGMNILYGNAGNDTLIGGQGSMFVDDRGSDTYWGDGTASLWYEFYETVPHAQSLVVGNGTVTDLMSGDVDRFSGVSRISVMTSGLGDTIVGGAVGLSVFSVAGADSLTGGSGNDHFDVWGGARVDGGAGFDILGLYRLVDNIGAGGNAAPVSITVGDTTATVTSGTTGFTLSHRNIELFILSGTELNDTLSGGAGDDYISLDAGSDLATGGAGNDYLLAGLFAQDGTGMDTVDGGAGTDVLTISAGDPEAALNLTIGADQAINEAGGGVRFSGVESFFVLGSEAADTIRGGNQAEIVLGQRGADIIDLAGGADQVLLNLDGETITGGAGADWYILDPLPDGNATITDLTAEDMLVLLLTQPGGISDGNGQNIAPGAIQVETLSDRTILHVGPTWPGTESRQITLHGVHTAADFEIRSVDPSTVTALDFLADERILALLDGSVFADIDDDSYGLEELLAGPSFAIGLRGASAAPRSVSAADTAQPTLPDTLPTLGQDDEAPGPGLLGYQPPPAWDLLIG